MRDKKGLTLTELIVATVLIGIVMLGVAAFNYALKGIQDTTNYSAILAMQAQGAMGTIVRFVHTATGRQGDSGIRCNPKLSTSTTSFCAQPDDNPALNYFSFREDASNINSATAATLEDYGDDIWVIFVHNAASHLLYSCQQPVTGGGPTPWVPNTAGGATCDKDRSTSLQLLNNVQSMYYEWDPGDGGSFFFEISITLRHDPTKASDPLKNPDYTVKTQVIPLAHSWGYP